MNTVRFQVSKDREYVRAACECGWRGPARRGLGIATFDADQHTHRRTQAQIAADRATLAESIGSDWIKAADIAAKPSDLQALINSGTVEAKVTEDLPGREWLQKGRLIRRTRWVRATQN